MLEQLRETSIVQARDALTTAKELGALQVRVCACVCVVVSV
jgi:hypothetical protein